MKKIALIIILFYLSSLAHSSDVENLIGTTKSFNEINNEMLQYSDRLRHIPTESMIILFCWSDGVHSEERTLDGQTCTCEKEINVNDVKIPYNCTWKDTGETQ